MGLSMTANLLGAIIKLVNCITRCWMGECRVDGETARLKEWTSGKEFLGWGWKLGLRKSLLDRIV